MKFRLVVSLLTAFILIVCSVFTVSAIKIDGFLDDKEWKLVDRNVLFSSSDVSNGNVRFGVMYVIVDEENDKLTLGFKATLTESISPGADYGAGVSFDGGKFIYVRLSGVSEYDTSKYGVDGSVGSTHDMSFSAEVVVSLKYGLDSADTIAVRFVDGNSVPTKVYSFALDEFVQQPTGETLVTTAPVVVTENTESATTSKTTKTKTTKPKTTKQKTTKQKSTKPKTTRKQTTEQNYTHSPETEIAEEIFLVTDESSVVPYSDNAEETTVLTLRSLNIQRGFSYAAVALLILLAFAICVMINLKHDKKNSGK